MRVIAEHAEVTRRYFLQLAAAGSLSVGAMPSWAASSASDRARLLEEAAKRLKYLTPVSEFKLYGRGNPPPHTLPPEKLREVGLTRDTWQLEVIPDPDSDAEVRNPLTKDAGTALDFDGLMRLAETKAVRILHVMTCTNGKEPCGMGLWEGVPLRDVIWIAQPAANVRRVFYYGYHNDDPEQRFQSSLPLGRVLEDPPGEHPVLLCYKLNNQWLTPKAGAPVRMFVPDRYGNMSVKWLQRVVLTNNFQANDTYAEWNNDTDSHLKTCARFIHVPQELKRSEPAAITGLAQVGMSGLQKVQYWVCPQKETWPEDDPYFTRAPWQDADVLPPPEHWGGDLPKGHLPPVPRQIDASSGRPKQWPLRGTIVHWAAVIEGLQPGKYVLRCRTVDANGVAQPMPRPYRKSGNSLIQSVRVTVV